MKKRIIIAAAFTACLALCAAVWPQAETVGETLAPLQTTRRKRPRTDCRRGQIRNRNRFVNREKKAAAPQLEPPRETTNEPEPAPVEASAAPDTRPTAESEHAPEPTPAPTPAQTVTDLQPGDMIYVEGFGWLEYQGPNHCEYGADIYENGNKIGIMG